MPSLLHAKKFVSVCIQHGFVAVRRNKAQLSFNCHPYPVHRNAVNAVTGKQEIVVDFKLSLCCGWGLREGRNKRPSPSAPFLAGLRSAALECLVRNVRLKCNNHLVEARNRRNPLSRDGKVRFELPFTPRSKYRQRSLRTP